MMIYFTSHFLNESKKYKGTYLLLGLKATLLKVPERRFHKLINKLYKKWVSIVGSNKRVNFIKI